MTEALRTLGLAMLGAFLSFVLREVGFRGARLLSVLVIAASVLAAVSGISKLKGAVFSFPITPEIESGVSYVMRIVGVSYVFGISSDVCREIGENGIASAVLTVGRVEIILLSLPKVSEIFSIAGELL